MLFLTAGVGHRFALVETIPFLWLLAIVGVVALFALLVGAIAFVTIWRRGRHGAGAAVAGTIFAMIALVPFAVSAFRAIHYPQLHDISTDLADPPTLAAAVRPLGAGTNAIGPITDQAAERQAKAYPEIGGRRYDYAPQRVTEQVEALLEERGWVVAARRGQVETESATTVEAIALSFFLGFKSDVAIRIKGDSSTTFVDMRSASRYGRHDLGDNAKRIGRFLTDLDRRVAAMAGL